MGETAENLANELSISERIRIFSIKSHEKALLAQSEGKFDNEIVNINLILMKLVKMKDQEIQMLIK